MKKLTLSFIKDEFGKEGYVVLSDEYKGSSVKLKYKCPKGHERYITWNKWKSGRRCPYCSENSRVRDRDIDYIRSELAKEGYILLSKEYKNCDEKLEYICSNGHRYATSWDAWASKGSRCAICSGNAILSIYTVRGSFENENYILLSNEYFNASSKLDYICPNGHIGSISWLNWYQGNRCSKCSSLISKNEKNMFLYIKKFLGDNILENDRTLITPYELDILIPDKKIAIEYCGLHWHSELRGKDRRYHLNKLNMCTDRGYRLITIFEDEFVNNKDVVLSRIKNVLNICDDINVVYARKCVVKEITAKEAREFCENNHLQGYTGCSIKLGAFYNNSLVSIMTFSKPSISKGQKNNVCSVLELSRFCSKKNYRVIGIASKLFSYFKKNYDWQKVFSYADRRWSDGNLYDSLGFKLIHNTRPNYWYTKGLKRIHRFSLRKQKTDPQDTTEWELRKSQGWNRIWDCGNLKYEISKES